MLDNYTSLLICDHETQIDFYCKGIPIAKYHKGGVGFEILEEGKKPGMRKVLAEMERNLERLITILEN